MSDSINDARRSWRDIAETVDLSPPAVADRVEHVLTTADGRVVFTAIADDGAVRDLLAQNVELADVREFDVSLLSDRSWSPSVEDVELGLTCDECGNTVTSEGESERLDGELYHFCCDSCHSSFVDMYENLRDGAET